MNSTLNNKKYKIQNKEDNIYSFNSPEKESGLNMNLIEKVIDNLDNYYNIINQLNGGGKVCTTKDDKYLNKYKNLIKSSKN